MDPHPAAPDGSVSVLVVDDEPDMRFLVRMLADTRGAGVTVVGEAADAEEALAQWRELRPDVVVADYLMPGRNGLELAQQVLREDPDQRVLLFSAHLDPATTAAAEAIGVEACVLKDRAPQLFELIEGEPS